VNSVLKKESVKNNDFYKQIGATYGSVI